MLKTHPEKVIKEQISKLKPLKYNQFFWWRKWDCANKPLYKDEPLIDKIKNGDFDFSHYFWQLQHCELELNEIYKNDDNPVILRERRKRLQTDFAKDEQNRLDAVKKAFLGEFILSEEEYDEEVNNCLGTLEDLYLQCVSKYFKRVQIPWGRKRGRPKK